MKSRILSGERDLRRLFAGLCEQTFQVDFGVADPPLIDYLSHLLERFVRMDDLFRVRDGLGRRLDQVGTMLSEARERTGRPRRAVFRHVGDFTLFWLGVYPEQLDRLKRAGRIDASLDYTEAGKRGYLLASETDADDDDEDADPELLRKLSEEFELCAAGLRKVRKNWCPEPSGS